MASRTDAIGATRRAVTHEPDRRRRHRVSKVKSGWASEDASATFREGTTGLLSAATSPGRALAHRSSRALTTFGQSRAFLEVSQNHPVSPAVANVFSRQATGERL